jgi:hypothetical protein
MRRCCKDRAHLTNKKDGDYAAKMGEALAEMRDSMKDLIYSKRIRNFKVLSTTMLFMDDTDNAADKLRAFWKDNAVHMTQEGYTELVNAVVNVITTATYTRPPCNNIVGDSSRGAKGNSGCQLMTLSHTTGTAMTAGTAVSASEEAGEASAGAAAEEGAVHAAVPAAGKAGGKAAAKEEDTAGATAMAEPTTAAGLPEEAA